MKSKSNANESARTMRANIVVGATNCTLNGILYQNSGDIPNSGC